MLTVLLIVFLLGCLLGRLAAGWAAQMLEGMNSGGLLMCSECDGKLSVWQRWFCPTPVKCPCGQSKKVFWHLGSTVVLGTLSAFFAWSLLGPWNCQGIHEVRPEAALLWSRLPLHLALLFLLWVAVLTDLLDYVIPDEVIWSGIGVAVVSAFVSGELQMVHIWVNWDEAVVSLSGPWLPEWMKHHQHLHGLAWSLTGAFVGATLIWLLRWLSGRILGYPALGLGDVTLMAMIGAFLGWQPAVLVIALAPLTGIVIGLGVRLVSDRSFVAYGPWLACSAFVVMCSWRFLWAEPLMLRNIFGHWPSLLILAAICYGSLIILLTGLRLFRRIPTGSLRR
ncbi:MAG: A24 family peptidase [Planctomycetaceae bacterium]